MIYITRYMTILRDRYRIKMFLVKWDQYMNGRSAYIAQMYRNFTKRAGDRNLNRIKHTFTFVKDMYLSKHSNWSQMLLMDFLKEMSYKKDLGNKIIVYNQQLHDIIEKWMEHTL